ncbi:MAG: RraA family protein [Planctomycetales bacterium]|nr:RraA family protein [Planctomycetales bacterium]
MDAAVIEKLQRYDTPTICNVIELFDVRPRNQGYMDHRIQCQFPEFKPMVGFAATAAFRSCAAPPAGDAYGSLEQQLELFATLDGPAVVVFQDLDAPPVGATFGEVMCSTYKAFGSAGLITSGGGRDLQQVRDIGFPVFTGSTICSHAYCHILHVGMPVHVGGISIQRGELLQGDENGVTTIPVEIAGEVADISEEFVQAERHVLDYVQADGPKSIEEFTSRRQAMGEAMAALRARVART